MRKLPFHHLKVSTLIAACAASQLGCSNFERRYDYSAEQPTTAPFHRIVSDHDNDGVRDFGDLCVTNGDNYFVNSDGCDPYREAEHYHPFARPEQCKLFHTGSNQP
ncbi:hypothetical protein HCU74_18255 [Spongiibacter sp. KMU-166]|uniref:Lipoprotein n=1 Tax=Spongiibacter thalassae TaxID=2721624 RepID=A0ABX1GLT7_9GAMM|nr:hypothetical protein [Spongiibacter thalassae]NKI19353.1 hypothetical protein [Spongiibacter thalassae]